MTESEVIAGIVSGAVLLLGTIWRVLGVWFGPKQQMPTEYHTLRKAVSENTGAVRSLSFQISKLDGPINEVLARVREMSRSD